jgi:hypothetical protein
MDAKTIFKKKSKILEKVLNTIINKSQNHIEDILVIPSNGKYHILIKLDKSFWGEYKDYDLDRDLTLDDKWRSIQMKAFNAAKLSGVDTSLIKF